MIISPPFLNERSDAENEGEWIYRMMPVDPQRDFPVNAGQSWHGGIHITGNPSESVRCIADGRVVSLRQPDLNGRTVPPFNYNGTTDAGYVLLKHETDIGSGEEGLRSMKRLWPNQRGLVNRREGEPNLIENELSAGR